MSKKVVAAQKDVPLFPEVVEEAEAISHVELIMVTSEGQEILFSGDPASVLVDGDISLAEILAAAKHEMGRKGIIS